MTDAPKAPRLTSAVLVEQDGKYLLCRRNKAAGFGKWIIPGGGVDFGETIQQAAVREIKEETGLDVELLKFIGAKEVIYTPHEYHSIIFFHTGKVTGGNLSPSDDASEAGFFTLDEIKKLDVIESLPYVFDRLGLIPKDPEHLDKTTGHFY